MKIRVRKKDFKEIEKLSFPKRKKPLKQSRFFGFLLKVLSQPELFKVKMKYFTHGMDRLKKDEPCLFLMNHSCFTDLMIASDFLFPRPFNIVCTSDGFVGKYHLMRALGCIPTNKFVTDVALVRDMHYALKTLKSSVLMYPEASYSFDGTETTLPESLGKCLKLLKVPVVTIITHGAFLYEPLYNGLQKRKTNISADVTYLLSPEDIEKYSAEELNGILKKAFDIDNFKWQYENKVKITEKFRADGLNRVLYKCPCCKKEGFMEGKGIHLSCKSCGKAYELTELGRLKATEGETEFFHIPDWYSWQRQQVREEILNGSYHLTVEVDIYVMADFKSIYKVGSGTLTHSNDGFILKGCSGDLYYSQKPSASYGLYADYFWYEIGDMVCIGDNKRLYYCFPKNGVDIAAKTRIAAEELFKMSAL